MIKHTGQKLQAPRPARLAATFFVALACVACAAAAADAPAGETSQVPILLEPRSVIRLTVELSPGIIRARERKASKEARYDFFLSNRRSISYGFGVDFDYDRWHVGPNSGLWKSVEPQISISKDFYNTTSASFSTGYTLDDFQEGHQADAFVEAEVTMPLFGSRESLERSNDKIFQQNELSDAQLDYYREIRQNIRTSLDMLAWAQRSQERLKYDIALVGDYEELLDRAKAVSSRDTTPDQIKLAAVIASARTESAGSRTDLEVGIQRVKLAVGLPFDTPVELSEEAFNPFEKQGEEELCRIALDTDEEMRTLLNSIKNSQAELRLARQGKWDTSLSLSARRDFAGGGERSDQHGYLISTGFEIKTIDPRISRSLESIALANIREYRSAIESRRRSIFADTSESCTQLRGKLDEVRERSANLDRYWESYVRALELYDTGHVGIEELIQRRRDIYGEQDEICRSRHRAREQITALIASTGMYEEFLDGENGKDSDAPSEEDEGTVSEMLGALTDTPD
jgi:hypothetical protein